MVVVSKLKSLAKKKGMNLKLISKRKNIWDFDVSGGDVSRVKIVQDRSGANANVYYGSSSKSGIDFKTEKELVDFMEEYN